MAYSCLEQASEKCVKYLYSFPSHQWQEKNKLKTTQTNKKEQPILSKNHIISKESSSAFRLISLLKQLLCGGLKRLLHTAPDVLDVSLIQYS